MSTATESESENVSCASCGIAGVDDIKLKDCDDCDLVKYCSDECQRDHRVQHKEECKKRTAELHDELLFKQPESTHRGDCPICCLPLPIDPKKCKMMSCCCKFICNGCGFAKGTREVLERLQEKCPFCRKAVPSTMEEHNVLMMKRVEANDPVATCSMGIKRYRQGNVEAAVEYWTRAAALGDVEAHYRLWAMYYVGEGVEKDENRGLHHLTEAAIGGHPEARYNLGRIEYNNDSDRAAKHFIIAANLGHDKSLKVVKNLYKDGYVSKEDFTAALRGHYAAIVAMKSPQREEAAQFDEWLAERRSGVV